MNKDLGVGRSREAVRRAVRWTLYGEPDDEGPCMPNCDVAFGSKPEVAALRLDVCFAPVSGRRV